MPSIRPKSMRDHAQVIVHAHIPKEILLFIKIAAQIDGKLYNDEQVIRTLLVPSNTF